MSTNLIKCKVDNEKGKSEYPFNSPLFHNGFEIDFNNNVAFIVGENGIGKSTMLEAIADKIGFGLAGGGRNQGILYDDMNRLLDYHSRLQYDTYSEVIAKDKPVGTNLDNLSLSRYMKLTWRAKRGDGFFFRAENFLAVARAKFGAACISHGEGIIQSAESIANGLYIFDEPESGLSPLKQLEFMSIIK